MMVSSIDDEKMPKRETKKTLDVGLCTVSAYSVAFNALGFFSARCLFCGERGVYDGWSLSPRKKRKLARAGSRIHEL